MRVLVTDTRNQQAYSIVTALRPHAQRIVVLVEGRNGFRSGLAPSAHSRRVDATYPAPRPPKAWLSPAPTDDEERYVATLLDVCRRERIDLIMPSRDEAVYTLARHRARFQGVGVALPVCDPAVQDRVMNKAEMLRVADRAGIPIPRTFVPRTRREFDQAIAAVGLPAIIKPAFDAGGVGLRYLMRPSDLDRYWRPPAEGRPDLLVQEFIPVIKGPNAAGTEIVMDRQGRVKALFQHWNLRGGLWNIGIPCACTVSACNDVVREQTVRLLRALGYWGVSCVEWAYDPRDGKAKLMEPNARIGATAWAPIAAGVNTPLILAQVTLGLDPTPVIDRSQGRFFIDPAVEVLSAGTYAANRLWRVVVGRAAAPPVSKVPRLGPWLKGLMRSYLTGRRYYSDYWRALGSDPWPALLWWGDQYLYCLRRRRAFLPYR